MARMQAGPVALLLLSGCCLDPTAWLPTAPTIASFEVYPGACLTWHAAIATRGRGTVELRVGGQVHASWPVSGDATLSASGVAAPGPVAVFEARLGDARSTFQLPLEAPVVTVDLSPPDAFVPTNLTPRFALSVDSFCPVLGTRWTATLSPGTWTRSGTVAPDGQVAIDLPHQPPGTYVLAVVVASPDGVQRTAQSGLAVGEPTLDLDQDGRIGSADCAEGDPSVHVGAIELSTPDGIDQNCDGRVDEGTTAYDDDGDGFAEAQGDCDDDDPRRQPGAVELPDCRDQDCDGTVDEGVLLAAVDDAHEPDDDRAHARQLDTSARRRFTETLDLVTRDVDDEEWFQFYSQDGDWDAWRIDAALVALPVGAIYDVEIYRSEASPMASVRVSTEGQGADVRGAAFRVDSGDYWVRVVPVHVERPWCPVRLQILSR
jgi:hypothetical protein